MPKGVERPKGVEQTEYIALAPGISIEEYFGEDHGWPTVVALRGSQMVGAISTSKRGLICGPLKVSVKPGIFIAIKLIEHYEEELRKMGVGAYLLRVEQSNKRWMGALIKSGLCAPIGADGNHQWFKREIKL